MLVQLSPTSYMHIVPSVDDNFQLFRNECIHTYSGLNSHVSLHFFYHVSESYI